MQKAIFILTLTLAAFAAKAQQESHFTNFMNNIQMLNPGYVGVREVPTFTMLHRSQWIGFKGAPVSQVMHFSSPFFNKRVGFGMSMFHRTAGITGTWSGSMAYSYELKISKQASLRLGLQGTFRYLGIDFSDPKVILRESDDLSAANGTDAMKYTGNFGLGAFFTVRQFYFGISVPNFFPNEIGFNDETLITAEEKPHFYALAGGVFPLSEKIRMRPTVLAKYVPNAPFDLDANLSLIFDNNVSVGFSYRAGGSGPGESLDLLMYYQISSKLGAGLGYDFSLGELARQSTGSFEALVKYDLRSDREDLTNPRFF